MPKDVRIIPAQGSIDFSLSQGFITSLIQLTDSGTLSIASTGPIQIGASNTVAIQIVSNNFVGINTAIPSQNLHVQGNLRLTGGLYDSTNSPGTANQLLISTGSGVAWTSVNVTGILTASGGIANRVSKFLDEDTLGNSNITDSGTQIVLGSASSVSGILTSFGYFGPGTNITNLNASNLASGTVPSAVVSGSYSGITSVGTLNGLTVSPGNIVLSPSVRSQTTSSPARYLYRGINNTLGARNESSVSLSPTFGRILNRNPDLLDQRLGYSTYDNNNSSQVNIGVTSDFSAPNSSGYVLAINYLGIGITAPSPGLGGYFVGLGKVTGPRDLPNLYGYRRGERIWHRIWASISTGYSINFGSNAYGDNGQFTWISSTIGTNDWYLYEAIQNIGTSGTFSDTAYYYLNSSVGTSNPVTWYVASTHLIGEDESPTVQYTSNLNIGYTTGLNQNFGDFANTGTTLLALNSANVGIRTFSPTRAFDVNADIRLRAILYDGNNTAGSAGQLLASTATGVVWTSATASGIVTGIGSINVIPKFGSAFSLTTSNISDSGTQIVFNTNTNTVGLATFRNISLTTSSLTTSAFMQFVGAYGDPITLNVGLATTGSISFNGSQGQLFTITNNLTTGSIFSVNDVSGIPSIDVNANGNILIAPYGGNIGIGTTNAPDPFRVQTTSRFIGLATFGAVNITRNLYDANSSTGLAGQLLSSVGAGVAWSSAASLGVVTGTGAASQITVWNSNNTITGFSTFVFVNPGVGINTTAPIKSLHIRNNGILIDGSSTSDPTGYSPRLIIDSGASTAFVLADFKNNLGSVFYVTGSRVSIGNSSVVTNVFNVNGGDALINTLVVGLGSGQIATNTALGVSALAANTTGNQLTAIGYQAGLSNTNAVDNTFIGYQAGRNNSAGNSNTAVGSAALNANTSGIQNAALGRQALVSNTTGSNNTAMGLQALNANTTGSNNTAFGFLALQNNVTTSGNTALGREALRYYANSSNQTAIGFQALQGNATVALNTGTQNSVFGYQAGFAITSGSNNTLAGYQAGLAVSSGSQNTFLGRISGNTITTGSNNTLLGDSTAGAEGSSYQIAIGQGAAPTASNLGAWGGNTNATRTNLGVGTFTPLGRLHVETLAAANIGVYIAGSASQTGNLFKIDSTTNGSAYFVTTGIGSVGIYTSVPTQPLHVQGNVRITGGILDSNNQIGLAGSVLSSTGSGISWIASAGASSVTGSGSTNRVAKFSGPTSVTDSTITDTGSVVTIGVGLSVSGFSSSFGFYGPGTFITNLNSSNLVSGTVPSSVVSGAYSGITSVGTLSQLIVTGISTIQNLELDGWLRDVNNSTGSSGQILSSTGSGVAWSSFTSLGIVTGSGSANQVTFWATNDRITGISTFIYNGALGIGTINPRGSLETNNEIYVDNIYFGIGNSFTNTLIGFAVSDGSFLDESVLIGYNVNDGSNSSKGVIIGSNASKGNDFSGFIDNAFSHVIIGTRASSNNIIRPGGGGKVIIGSNAYSYINNINDQDSGNLVVIGTDAYSGSAANLKEDVVRSTIIGPNASQYASHGDSVIIGTLTGFNTDPANLYSSIYNTIIGNDAGVNFNSASYNTIIGRAANSQTANSVFSGGYNVLLGDSTQVSNNNYQIAIGANATVSKANSGAWGGITNLDRVDLGIGTFAAAARLHVQTLSSVNNGILVAGGVGQTASLLEVDATLNGATYFIVTGIGSVGVNTSIPTQSLDVNGGLRLRERLFDNSNSSGSINQILISTGSGIAWTTSTATGIITGSGVVNSVARFSGPNSLSTSTITDNGSVVTIGVGVSIAGFSSSFGFYGPGTNLTNLNASNLASGTVPSAVVSGSYSGITSVGNLTNLNVIGIASATGFSGDGANLTNLNATNLASGTVNSARISGSYSGITSVGNLTNLNVIGIATATGFSGNGANLTNLNASNLASGTVPSAVVSGSYSGITSVGTQSQLIVSGFSTLSNVRISGALYDTSFGPGLPGRLLSSTGSGIAWTTTDASGIVTSLAGTVNAIPKYNSPFSFTTSTITDNGVAVTVASRLNVTGIGSFTADLIVNGLTVGLGSGQNNTNVVIGLTALARNPSNSSTLIAIGDRAMNLAFGSFFGSIAIGSQALQNNQASRNIGIGNQALRSTTTGASNVAIGHLSMDQNVSGSASVAVGRGTLQNSTSSSNTAVGDSVLNLATTDENTAVGVQALNNLTSGRANQAFGSYALRYVATVSNLTAVGYAALAGSATTTLNSGTQNTALGYQAGTANTSGANNVFIGFQAGLANTSGSRNVFVGRSSGVFISSGSDNTFIGDATNGVPGASYQIGVGASVIPTASNFGAWGGNTNATRTDLGVGTFSPQARIHVETLAAGNRGLYIAGAASQTSNLIEVDATTDGSPLFLVTGIGSVGINTGHAPRYLYVQGDTRLNGPVGIVGDPVAGYPLSVSGSINLTQGSVLSWAAGNADIQSGGSSAWDMRFRTFSGSFARENMRIMSNGNVGIGTSGPFAKLHVQGIAETNTPLILSGFGTPTVDLFRIEQNLGGTRYITVDSTGELGIGTSTPTQSLHVQLNSRFNGAIFDVNNLPGAPIGIVSQALFSTGTGVTWAPVKRNLVVPLMTAFNPTQVGIDSAIFIVPQDPINGTSSMTFNFRRVNVRVETPSAAGITTINIAKSTGTGQFVGTSILSANINLTGASTYETFGTSFAVGYTTASSGDKLAINFVGVNTFHQNLTVELIAIEA